MAIRSFSFCRFSSIIELEAEARERSKDCELCRVVVCGVIGESFLIIALTVKYVVSRMFGHKSDKIFTV